MDECLLCALMLRDPLQYIAAVAGAKVIMASFASFRRNNPGGLLAFYLYLNHGFLDGPENMEWGEETRGKCVVAIDRSLQL